MARTAVAPPVVSWEAFASRWPNMYRQGQHVAIIGPTNSGKSTLAFELQKPRGYVVMLGTKKTDKTLERYAKTGGFKLIEKWPPRQPGRVALWVKPKGLLDAQRQRRIFGEALSSIYDEGNWTVVVDETYVMAKTLRLREHLAMMWTQGRSEGISLIALMQRPVWVPNECFANSHHLFIFKTGEENDLRKMGGFGKLSGAKVANVVETLEDHEWLYVAPFTGKMARCKMPNPNNRKAP